jgi:hypothetical protein
MKKIKWVVMAFAILQAFVVHNAFSQAVAPVSDVPPALVAARASTDSANYATVTFTRPATNTAQYYKIMSSPGNRSRLVIWDARAQMAYVNGGGASYNAATGAITVYFGTKETWAADSQTYLAGGTAYTFYVAPSNNLGVVTTTTSTASNVITTKAATAGDYIVTADSAGNYTTTPDFIFQDYGTATPVPMTKTSGRYLIMSNIACHIGPTGYGPYVSSTYVFTCNGRTDWEVPTFNHLQSFKSAWGPTRGRFPFSKFSTTAYPSSYNASYLAKNGNAWSSRNMFSGAQDEGKNYSPLSATDPNYCVSRAASVGQTQGACRAYLNFALGVVRASNSNTGG